MKALLAAFRFLTILPLPGPHLDEEAMARSVVFFPVVGATIGGFAALLAVGLAQLVPGPLAAVVIVLALAGASGGLHLDGLADTADGFGSRLGRVEALRIMRDSRVGTMGVIALVGALGLKGTALAGLPAGRLWRAALLAPLAGRCALLVVMALLEYVRPEGGLGTSFYRRRPRAVAVAAVVVLLAAGWFIAGPAGLISCEAAIAGVVVFALYARRRVGGATGDVLGAGCEVAETVTLVFLCGWYFAG